MTSIEDESQFEYTYRLPSEQAKVVTQIAVMLNVKNSEVCKWIFDEGIRNLPSIFNEKSQAIRVILQRISEARR
jgi:phosphoribosyl-dephospho-CoA transferase